MILRFTQDAIHVPYSTSPLQSLVFLSSPKTNVPEAVECAASADIFVSSESEFSHATAMVSKNVRVLTDRWSPEEEETMMTLEPATTVAGMGSNQAKLGTIIREYRDCIMDSTSLNEVAWG